MQPNILLVDDEPAMRFGFPTYLSKSDYVVREASSLTEGRQALLTQTFNALILNLNLPDGFAMDEIAGLRASHPALAIAVITGVGDSPLAVDAMPGVDHFICSPVNMEDLVLFWQRRQRKQPGFRKTYAERCIAHPCCVEDVGYRGRLLRILHCNSPVGGQFVTAFTSSCSQSATGLRIANHELTTQRTSGRGCMPGGKTGYRYDTRDVRLSRCTHLSMRSLLQRFASTSIPIFERLHGLFQFLRSL